VQYLTALHNVSEACVTFPPCTCPRSPDGIEFWLPVETSPGVWDCQLALVGPPVRIEPVAPVPALSSWALAAVLVTLAILGAWRLRP
jgi:hypothetical protein